MALSKGASPLGLKVARHAATYVGVSEHPAGSNHGPQVDGWCYRAAHVHGGIPWCGCFQWCMGDDVGENLAWVSYPASVLSWVQAAYKTGRVVKRPFRGDRVAYSWDGPDPTPNDHIEIVERVLALPSVRSRSFLIRTIGGNTGNAVQRKWRRVVPAEAPSDTSVPHVVFIRNFDKKE